LFRNPDLAITPDDVLVDVGCGKGRVINFWLHRGCRNRIIGIDLREDVARRTAARLSRFPNVSILAGDAIDCVPRDGTFFYLYNPFGADTLKAFIERLGATNVAPARVRILYLNALHQQVFEADARWTIKPLSSGTVDSAALITIRP
jgi:hypothetical protein